MEIEISLKEFEALLDKDLIDNFIDIIVKIFTNPDLCSDEDDDFEIMSISYDESTSYMEEFEQGLLFEEVQEIDSSDGEEINNSTVNRIYKTIMNGEK